MNQVRQTSSEISKEFRDHARALLVSLGCDPNPSNLSKLRQVKIPAGVKISVELKDYLVYRNDSISSVLEQLILTNPLALPARYLALFISSSMDRALDFSHCIQIAENFKRNPTHKSIYTLRSILINDKFINDHLNEILLQEFGAFDIGLQSIANLYGFELKSSTYKDQLYWIMEFTPKSRIIEILCNNEVICA